MLALLFYTEKKWAIGFRPLKKQMKFITHESL